MLGDDRRLGAFRAAIDGLVWDGATVVDIGTGTGILASYAAARTSGTVHALDVDPNATRLAERLCRANGLGNIRVLNAASYGRPLDCAPDVVISETLGVVGVDERIVETLYEFCVRYPSVRAPRFCQTLTVPADSDGVLLYFVAELGAGQTLSTALAEPPNHWGRAWVLRPNADRHLQVSSDPRKSTFDLYWE